MLAAASPPPPAAATTLRPPPTTLTSSAFAALLGEISRLAGDDLVFGHVADESPDALRVYLLVDGVRGFPTAAEALRRIPWMLPDIDADNAVCALVALVPDAESLIRSTARRFPLSFAVIERTGTGLRRRFAATGYGPHGAILAAPPDPDRDMLRV